MAFAALDRIVRRFKGGSSPAVDVSRAVPAGGDGDSPPTLSAERARVRIRTTLPLIVALLGVYVVTTALLMRASSRELESDAATLADSLALRLAAEKRLNVNAMHAMLDHLSNEPGLLEAYESGDRESVAEILVPALTDIERSFGVSHLYVHDLERNNFLRAHRLDLSGGPVDRWTLDEASATGEFSAGFEPGLLGTFTLRCVLPWEHNGRVVGYLELGKEFDRFAQDLGERVIVVVPKAELDQTHYVEATERLRRENTWDRYADVVLPYGDPGELPGDMADAVRGAIEGGSRDLATSGEPAGMSRAIGHEVVTAGATTTQIVGVPLRNAAGASTARILFVRDLTHRAMQARTRVRTMSGGLLVLVVVVTGCVWLLTGRIERELDHRQARLISSNDRMNRSEQALREREARLQAILDAEPECVKIIDAEGCLIDMNPAGLELVEVDSIDDVRGVSVYELVTAEYHDLFREGVAAALAGESVVQQFEIVGCRGTRRWMEQYSVAMPPEKAGDEPTQVLAVTRDVSDQVRARDELVVARDRAERNLREAQALRRTVDQHSIVSVTDPDGRIIEVNEMFTLVSGYSREEAIGSDHSLLKSGLHPREFWAEMWGTIQAGRPWRNEVCNRAKDGSLYWVDMVISPFVGAEGRIEKFVSILTDITERKLADEKILESQAELNEAQRLARIGSWTLDCRTERLEWSDVACEIFEVDPAAQEPTFDSFLEAIHPEDRSVVLSVYTDSVRYRRPYSIKHRILLPDGRVKHLQERGETTYDADGRPVVSRGTVQDVTDITKAEVELRTSASTDRLTSLANRELFRERLEQAMARSRSDSSYLFAVVFLDLDRFKIVNDSLGHSVGDALLQEVGRRLRNAVRVTDSLSRHARGNTAARLGGDEFVLLLDGIDSVTSTEIVARRLLDVLSQPHKIGDQVVHSPASIGVVTSHTQMESAEEVLRNADIAMYEAKAAGKGCFVLFDESMHKRVHERHRLEHDLQTAIEGNELRLVYQPIIDLNTASFVSCEALVRWDHPVRGPVSPAEFVPIAEDTGFISQIGEWVLWEACHQFAAWRAQMGERAPGGISVNISRVQLMVHGLAEQVERILRETGVPAECLQLEVTESAIMRDAVASRRVLERLKEIGVKLAIDDFGTGYSSLASVHQFPVDVLKIDRAFIADLRQGRVFLALISAISQLAHNLGITTVAEGVETIDHVTLLQSLDCDLGQGYLFSRPLEADQIIEFEPTRIHLEGEGNKSAGSAA